MLRAILIGVAIVTFTIGTSLPCGAQSCTFPSFDGYAPVTAGFTDRGAVADLDGDGGLDLVTDEFENTPDGPVFSTTIHLNDGAGGATTLTLPETEPAWSFALADLNGDGVPDLVRGALPVARFTVRLGNGDGTFGAPATYEFDPAGCDLPGLPGRVAHLEAVDMDNDGAPDIVASSWGCDAIGVFTNAGNGTFLPAVTYPAGAQPTAFTTVDLDLDGWMDVVVPDTAGAEVRVFMNEGDGALALTATIPVSDAPWTVVSGDFDEDGLPDLIVSTDDPASTVLLGEGDGTFTTGPSLVVPRGGGLVALIDANGDEHVDLVCQRSGLNHRVLSMFIGQGDGTFAIGESYESHNISYVGSLAVGDWTGDGIDDVIGTERSPRVFPGNGDGTLDALPAVGIGGSVAIVADMNGDGIPDLVGNSRFPGVPIDIDSLSVKVALGHGDGTFAAPIVSQQTSEYLRHLSAGDLDGDGDTDIVATMGYSVHEIIVFLNDGDGGLAIDGSYSTYDGPLNPALGDIDEDGYLDILAGHYGQPLVRVLLGNGDGTFRDGTPLSSGGLRALLLVDLDGDGHLDVAQREDFGFLRCLGNGDGTFQPADTFALPLPDSDSHSSLTASDVNADGVLDILAMGVVEPEVLSVVVRLGDGAGDYGPVSTFATGLMGEFGPKSLSIDDYDGDGAVDVAATYSLFSYQERFPIRILHGLGDGTFGPPSSFEAGESPNDLAAADLDGDGAVDLIAANINSRSVSILFNQCSDQPTCPADVDGSGTVDVVDLVNVILAWGSDDAAADVTGDGIVNVLDLVEIILGWGPCV